MLLEELLKSYADKTVFVLLNAGGNRGDVLVREGRRRLFRQNRVLYIEIKYPGEAPGEILFVEGSGCFNGLHNHHVDETEFYLKKFEKVVLLPSSFDTSYENIRNFVLALPPNMIVYCREKYSFDEVTRIAPCKENIFLDKDTAFYFDYSKWRRQGKGVLVAFRTDIEKNKLLFNRLNRTKLRLRLMFKADFIDVSRGSKKNIDVFLEQISRYDEVHTDRAHVAIAAALLGKKTFVYPNNYHKLKGIYECSLSHLPNVKWMMDD